MSVLHMFDKSKTFVFLNLKYHKIDEEDVEICFINISFTKIQKSYTKMLIFLRKRQYLTFVDIMCYNNF